ncbi:MAG: hypothetical protein K2W96_21455 [Gemmataceae bacterium]|nr:hypothetical protein [Gemmataceae bacterium]
MSKEPAGFKVPWGFVLLVVLGLVAWASNPDQKSLDAAWRQHLAKTMNQNTKGVLERVAASVLVETSVERKNYFFFSLAEIKAGLRFDRDKRTGYAFGAFGFWWF